MVIPKEEGIEKIDKLVYMGGRICLHSGGLEIYNFFFKLPYV